ncbi:MAG: ComF family protein [Acidobacteria bacterium]|nr:ComF family protein [Acidobacteriota bacterium]
MAPLEAEFLCARCRTPFTTPYPLDEAGVCAACRSGLRSYDAAYSYAFYEGTAQKLIHLLKYAAIHTLARPLSRRLSLALPRDQRIDSIVPVPLHWTRNWSRGFNQSALLARELSRLCGIPCVNVLRRSRRTPSQAGLSDRDRRRNVSRCFEVKTADLTGQHILLVDDVLTTGSTAAACAQALKKAGAARVVVLTLARADRRISMPAPALAASARANIGVDVKPM